MAKKVPPKATIPVKPILTAAVAKAVPLNSDTLPVPLAPAKSTIATTKAAVITLNTITMAFNNGSREAVFP
jgi:hypothetical protein